MLVETKEMAFHFRMITYYVVNTKHDNVLRIFVHNKGWPTDVSVRLCAKAINSGSAYSILFLSMTGLFPACRKILEHEAQVDFGLHFVDRIRNSWIAISGKFSLEFLNRNFWVVVNHNF